MSINLTPERSRQYSGNHTIGGYQYSTATGLRAFGSDRIRETAWAGASYEDGPWKLIGAWYFFSQNSFLSNAGGRTGGLANNTCAGGTLEYGERDLCR